MKHCVTVAAICLLVLLAPLMLLPAPSRAAEAGAWAVVTTQDPAYGVQSWATDTVFPLEFIKREWDRGYNITEVAYGDGMWAVVMTEIGDYAESLSTESAFPKDTIQKQWDNGYRISELEYGDGLWAVVTTYTDQHAETWFTDSTIPKTTIKEKWDQGYRITSLTYHPAPEGGPEPRTPQQPQPPAPLIPEPTQDAGSGSISPDFLLQGWIIPISPLVMRTYDFTQQDVAGQRTVEIRSWQKIGTLGWQSMQQYTALFFVDDQRITIESPTGYRENWLITSVQADQMNVQDDQGLGQVWYNCSASGWPQLIYYSTRGCQ